METENQKNRETSEELMAVTWGGVRRQAESCLKPGLLIIRAKLP